MKRALLLMALTCVAGPATAADCADIDSIRVAGAQQQTAACLPDLSTRYLAATGHTDVSDWGTLHSQQTRNPRRPSPASSSTATSPTPRRRTRRAAGSTTRSS